MSGGHMAKIVIVGSLNMDVVAIAPRIPVTGETIIGNKYFTAPGGKGAAPAAGGKAGAPAAAGKAAPAAKGKK